MANSKMRSTSLEAVSGRSRAKKANSMAFPLEKIWNGVRNYNKE